MEDDIEGVFTDGLNFVALVTAVHGSEIEMPGHAQRGCTVGAQIARGGDVAAAKKEVRSKHVRLVVGSVDCNGPETGHEVRPATAGLGGPVIKEMHEGVLDDCIAACVTLVVGNEAALRGRLGVPNAIVKEGGPEEGAAVAMRGVLVVQRGYACAGGST